jgi:lipoyl(octanoyl) transferase
LLNETQLSSEQIEFFKINRGGDITYHGPGQITGYPIFDLDDFFTDIHRYVRTIEQIVIDTLLHYDIVGFRIPKYTGVWVKNSDEERKICAIGIHLSRWVTMHGFALNVNTDLSYFNKIVPCGITKKSVTSISKETQRHIDMNEVQDLLKKYFEIHFNFEYKIQ